MTNDMRVVLIHGTLARPVRPLKGCMVDLGWAWSIIHLTFIRSTWLQQSYASGAQVLCIIILLKFIPFVDIETGGGISQNAIRQDTPTNQNGSPNQLMLRLVSSAALMKAPFHASREDQGGPHRL